MNLRPCHDGVLVKVDPFVPRPSSIIMLEPSNVRKGTVVRLGKDVRDLEVGERVAFFRWNQEHKQGRELTSRLKEIGDDLVLLDFKDVLFALTGEVELDV